MPCIGRGVVTRPSLSLLFLLWLGGCLRVPGVRPGGRVTFCLRQKVTKNRFSIPAAELTASPGGLSVRTTAASQNFHKRKVRHIASLVPVNLATSRDMVRESRAEFGFVFIGLGSRMLERACEAKWAFG